MPVGFDTQMCQYPSVINERTINVLDDCEREESFEIESFPIEGVHVSFNLGEGTMFMCKGELEKLRVSLRRTKRLKLKTTP